MIQHTLNDGSSVAGVSAQFCTKPHYLHTLRKLRSEKDLAPYDKTALRSHHTHWCTDNRIIDSPLHSISLEHHLSPCDSNNTNLNRSDWCDELINLATERHDI